jgi:hypothetical protein
MLARLERHTHGKETKEEDVSGGDGGEVGCAKRHRFAASVAPRYSKNRKVTGKAQVYPQQTAIQRRMNLPFSSGFFPFWEYFRPLFLLNVS